jgi:hypothetical protein
MEQLYYDRWIHMIDANLPVINMETGVYRNVKDRNPNWQKWMQDSLALYGKYGVSYSWYAFDPDRSGSDTISMLNADRTTLTEVGLYYNTSYLTDPVSPSIFSDGFEGGSFSSWTGSNVWVNDAITISATNSHLGTYAAQADLASSGGRSSYYYVNLPHSYSTLYYRVYFKISSVATGVNDAFSGDGRYVSCLALQNNANYVALAGLYRTNGTVQWYVQYRSGGVWKTSFSAAPKPTANVWCSIELKQVTDGAIGEERLYINGAEIITVTGLANNDRGNPNQALVFGDHVNSKSLTAWIDDPAVSTSYLTDPVSPSIFSDGFEGGSFSSWTGSNVWVNDAITISATNSHLGTYAAQADLASSGGRSSYYYVNLPHSYSTLYYRVYFKISSVATGVNDAFSGDGRYVSCLALQNNANYVALAGLYRTNGTVQWYVQYRSGGVWKTSFSAAPKPTANVWCSIELKQVTDGAIGEERLYINGAEIITVTGLANNDRGNPNQALVFGDHVNSKSLTAWIDDPAVSTTHNG